jgi:preprotein translocase subunit SecA
MDELLNAHSKGQPVLVVTSSIEMSYLYSQTLLEYGIPHNVLNAYNVPKEAEIIKNAGQRNAVTIATAIAGRGTDIKLGKGVEELGGLYVLGIGRMANKRLETQARGRSGRQGDPGCSQFFVCLDDKIIQDYGSKSLKKYHDVSEIKRKHVIRMINHAQRNNEVEAYRSRMRTLEYDSSTSAQRTIIYKLRNDILDDKLTDDAHIEGLIEQNVDAFIASEPDEAQVERFILDHIQYKFDRSLDYQHDLKKTLMTIIHNRLKERQEELAVKQRYPQYVRICILNALDNAWIEQVDYLEQLKAAVSYRQYAQKNVIYEFHQDAYRGFEKMLYTARENALKNIMLSFVVEKQAGSFTVILP